MAGGILDTAVVFPMWQLLVGFLILWLPLVYFLKRMFWDDKRYCPERDVLVNCSKNGLPVIGLVDIGSNNATLEAGAKERTDDIKFKSQFSGIRIDPILTSVGCQPLRINGLDFYWYAFESWLPQTVRNNLAMKAITEYKDKNCQDLSFLTDIEFVALVSTPETHLHHDIQMYINKYFKNVETKDPVTGRTVTKAVRQFMQEDPATCQIGEDGFIIPGTGTMVKYEQDIDIQQTVDRIEKIKNDIANLPISRGWFSMTEAFKNNAYAYAAQDLEMLLVIHDKQAMADMYKKINILLYGVAGMLIAVGGGLGFYMISLAISHMK